MHCSRSLRLTAAIALLAVAPTLVVAEGEGDPVELASKQVIAYLTNLSDLLCRESVLQEKLAPNGHLDSFERSNFEYFILIDADGDNFQLTESRVETSQTPHRQQPLLVTNGFSSLLLIFHPYYRDSFHFEVGGNETIGQKQLVAVNFTQLSGHRAPAALALRGRQFALQLRGTAWIDGNSGQIMKMEASLANDMSDIGLHALHISVDYQLTARGPSFPSLVLPTQAIVEVESIRERWRNTHTFSNYKTFSTSTEQDPKVTIHQPTNHESDHPANATPSDATKEIF